MATTNFKLTKDKVTRRFSFPLRPPWDALSAKIQSVYDIPAGRVAVSYTDSDGDVVTLSTNEELQDYYAAGLTLAHQLIRFDVVDLGALRETTSPTSTVRAIPTMGAGQPNPNDPSSQWNDEEFFDVGTEWPHYPDPRTFSGLFEGPQPPAHQSTPSELSHGFLETLKSDVSHVSKAFDSEVESDNESDIVDLSGMSPGLDKGKGRADMRPTVEEVPDEEFSSDRSILCADAPQKIPIHVMDVHDHRSSKAYSERAPSVSVKAPTEKAMSEKSFSDRAYSEQAFYEQAYSDRTPTERPPTEKAPSFIADGFQPSCSSTPHMSILSVDRPVLEAPPAAEPVPDPPLAPLPTDDRARALSPTFTTDIASLLNDLKNAFGSHPELSEGLRNILSHAGNGSYWAAHREAVSRAAASVSGESRRSTEDLRRQAEEEASRRVAEALGGLVRSFTTMTAGMRGDQVHPTSAPRENPRETEAWDRFDDGGSPRDSLWGSFRQTDRRGGAGGGSVKRTSWGLPHYGPTQQFDWGRPLNLSSRYWGPESDTGNPFDDSAPRGPSRRRSLLGFPPQASSSPMGRSGPPGPPGPFPPPPPPPPHHRMHGHGHPHQRDHDRHSRRFASDPMPPPGADFPPPHHRHEAPRHDGLFMPLLTANPTPQELRERVEIAKQAYQMEKARYRKDREERKRDRRIQE